MMGEVLSNSTPHHVVVASPFQLGWKAVAVRSKQLPQGEFGGAAPAYKDGAPDIAPEDEEAVVVEGLEDDEVEEGMVAATARVLVLAAFDEAVEAALVADDAGLELDKAPAL